MLKHPVIALMLFAMSLNGAGCAFFGSIAFTNSSALAALIFGGLGGNFKLWLTSDLLCRNAVGECTATHFLRLF